MSFTFHDKSHRYFLDGKPLTGVTTILSVIAKPALVGWAARMATERVAELWEPEREYKEEEIKSILDDAVNAHKRKKEKAAEQGTDIHSWIEDLIKASIGNTPKPDLPTDEIAREQAEQFIQWEQRNNVRWLESEKKMYSRKHWIAGTCDAVAIIDGKKYVVDIKTMAKIWDRTPFLQMAGYRLMLEEMGEKEFEGSLVLLLPKGGTMEEKYSYDLEGDMRGFTSALELYRTLGAYDPDTHKKLKK